MTRLLEATRGFARRLREFTGEARWDDYLAGCRRTGTEPVSRREFERHRDQHREESARSSCC